MSDIHKIVITEAQGGGVHWFMNIGKYDSDDDIEIPSELAQHILKLQSKETE